ncbi:MAG: macro domain-containing protein [Candidatus Bipolaricaulota bacterium]
MVERTEATIAGATLWLVGGDITKQETEAVVNAANPDLAPGGGVAGAIHRAGGPELTEACAEIRRQQGPLPTGEAVITSGGNLPAPWAIHTVGPVWHGGQGGEPELLARCYRACLALARERGLRSISFPSLSTGAYGYPVGRAAPVALGAVGDFLRENPDCLEEVRFVLFSERDLAVYADALGHL